MNVVTDHKLGGDYPTTWEAFIGQNQVKRQLQMACQSAKMRGVRLDHILLASGRPGIGKTSLALLAANEMDTNIHVISGKITAVEARIAISGMSDMDILFYDEIHQAVMGGKNNAGWLLHLLQDGVLIGPRGPEVQPKITVIGATTDVGKLPEAVIERFICPALQPYTLDEATIIAMNMAQRILLPDLPLPGLDCSRAIAVAASNNPRTINQILRALRDIALCDNSVFKDGKYELTEPLAWLGLSFDGLTQTARVYLVTMLTQFDGTAGERTLMDTLQEPGGLAYTERLLNEKGYLARTRTGRMLTQAGIKRARELHAEHVAKGD